MNTRTVLIILVILAVISVISRKMKTTASTILASMKIRVDSEGNGHFGASRDGGSRGHNGVDLLVMKGEPVYAPFSGTITKQAYPYSDDRKFTGVHLTRPDGLKIKVFYMLPKPGIIGKAVAAGQEIGRAQAISEKYGDAMKDHIHIEVWNQYGTLENAEEFFNLS
jgi:murein DD-endopeptidase MepM/ murein hydrolase activator NlpD